MALQDSVELSLLRYRTGLANYFEVLGAQQQLYPAEDALAQAQRDQLLAVVGLYKALGGGWNLDDRRWEAPATREVAAGAPPPDPAAPVAAAQ